MTVEELPGEGLPELIHTPGQRTIDEVGAFLNVQPQYQIKTMAYMLVQPGAEDRAVVAFLRGDHQLNEAKLAALAGAGELRPMQPEEIVATFHSPAGYLGPVGLAAAPHPKKPGTLVILDKALDGRANLVAGANRAEYHLLRVTPTRDFKPTLTADIRSINEGEGCPVCDTPLKLGKAVEIGHIFKLGYKYSKSMGASVLNQDGKEVTPIMGSYGIGIERILTAAIETSAARFEAAPDAKPGTESYVLPPAIAPFEVVVTITNVREPDLLAAGEAIAMELAQEGFDVLLDDRDERAGVKFKDADLIGVPYRVNIGKKLVDGKIELVDRLTGLTEDLPMADVAGALRLKLEGTAISPLPVATLG
jgi:prolyl-tRNA synthetase